MIKAAFFIIHNIKIKKIKKKDILFKEKKSKKTISWISEKN